MNMLKILELIKMIIPSKKIAAWVLGLLAIGVSIMMGVKGEDLKEQFCANPVISVPQLPQPEVQKLEQKDVK